MKKRPDRVRKCLIIMGGASRARFDWLLAPVTVARTSSSSLSPFFLATRKIDEKSRTWRRRLGFSVLFTDSRKKDRPILIVKKRSFYSTLSSRDGQPVVYSIVYSSFGERLSANFTGK